MVTSPEHEQINRTLSLLVELLAEEFDIESCAFGSISTSERISGAVLNLTRAFISRMRSVCVARERL